MEPAEPTEREHRFLVRSAEEAVRTIRETLGESAQVTSVRRVERSGLTGLFKGPQLEVIARVPVSPAAPTPSHTPALPLSSSSPAGAVDAPVNPWDADLTHPVQHSHVPARENLHALPHTEPAPMAPAPAAKESRLTNLLSRAGMSDVLLARIQASPEWARIERLSLAAALPETANILRREFSATPRATLGTRMAFLGMAGAGSTSILCKHLARCVFSLGQKAAVFRLETDRPNPIDGLAAVCELWGVPLLRSEEEMPAVRDDMRLYVDVPGLTADAADREEGEKIAARLEKLAIGSRVFVLNAAYEPALLKGLCRRATLLGCKHLAFTHLDELVHWGKMWEFLLHRDLSTEFYSLGPSLPGDFSEDVLENTLAKTFA